MTYYDVFAFKVTILGLFSIKVNLFKVTIYLIFGQKKNDTSTSIVEL